MAIPNSKTVSSELLAVLDRFEFWLYTNVRIGNSTAQLYLGFVRRAYPFLGVDPSEQRILEYLVAMRRSGASNNTVCATCTALERFSAFLGRPIKLMRPRAESKVLPNPMTEAEIAVFLHASHTLREKAILALLAYSGIRNSEFCHLHVRDLDVASGLIRVMGKFSKERVIGVAGECVAILIDYVKEAELRPEDLLFSTVRHGYELEPQDIRKLVRVVAKRAGITRRIWPHLLRHSLATNMLERGANIMTIQTQLGHVFLSTTVGYLHCRPRKQAADYRQFAPSYL